MFVKLQKMFSYGKRASVNKLFVGGTYFKSYHVIKSFQIDKVMLQVLSTAAVSLIIKGFNTYQKFFNYYDIKGFH